MLNKIKYFLTLAVLLYTSNFCLSQFNGDSLKNVIFLMPNDNASIYKIIELGLKIKQVNYPLALEIFRLAEKKHGEEIIDSASGVICTNLAHLTIWLGNSSESIRYYLKTKQIGEQLKMNIFIATGYSGLAAIYQNNKDFKKAIEFYEKAANYYTNNYAESKKYESINTGNMGYTYYQISQTIDTTESRNIDYYNTTLAKAIMCNKRATEIAKQLKSDSLSLIKATTNVCLEYIALGNLDSAVYYYDYSYSILPSVKELDAYSDLAYTKGKLLFLKNDFNGAIKAFNESLDFALKMKYMEYVYENYFSLYQCYQKLGNYKDAMMYFTKFTYTKDSVLNIGRIIEGTELRNMYETQIKEYQIANLTTANKQKSMLNKVFIGSSIGLCLLGFLGYRNFKNKQKVSAQQQEIQEQKITELEKDKQLSAIDAMLKGQEEERSRIAKDLHDGLGGMLSGTKLSFINMKDNLVLTPENAVQFDKSLSMLDNTIADLRKVAHNLMPEALVKFGLDEALRDFCHSIQSSSSLKVVYQQVGENRKLSNTTEVFTYRIIQELVNNAVKHAGAKQIIVQLNINSHKLSITVEDDGKGFDINSIANSKGAGMDNIKYRVQYFNGTLDIVTAPDKGTSVNIDLTA
jgi:two-component system, NarL family, sensor kinase